MYGTMMLIRGIKNLWKNAMEYANEYYDQLNEIQVVTEKSDTEITTLTERYRNMASQMSVSSKDIASAATTFYRQGLGDAEVEQRLKYTTQFAKVASVEFTQAAELITATANSMSKDIQGNIQRVVDVFVYLGDHAGTSGQEVATAMQKTAAAAGQFGVSFEWLGAYIATVSETTRQAAEVVGTSLNSIISRLHSIRSTGYNSEDETKINDVAKALATVDIALLDQEGNWRDMTDIFNEIAAQWDTMNDKQRSYIATTMAGVRQQNTFLALMADLSKGLEGGSRAWELYTGAMQASGTVAEKYATWERSVEAAEGRLSAATEKLYNTLWNGDVSKAFKNVSAGFVEALAAGNQFLGGLGPLIIAIGAVGVVAIASSKGVGVFGAALTALKAHSALFAVGAAIVGVTSLIAILGAVAQQQAKAFAAATEDFEKAAANVKTLTDLKSQVAAMQTEVENGNKTLDDFTGLLASVSSISPTASNAVAGMKSGALTAKEGFAILNGEIET